MSKDYAAFGSFLSGTKTEYRPQQRRLSTCHGILIVLSRHQLRLLCPCGEMGYVVVDVIDCVDEPGAVVVDCQLSCGCLPRTLRLACRSERCQHCQAIWAHGQVCHRQDCPRKKVSQ